jgi:hypothetical protein
MRVRDAPGSSAPYRRHQTGSALGTEEPFCDHRRRRPACIHRQLRAYSACDSVPWLQRNWPIFSTVGIPENTQIVIWSGTKKRCPETLSLGVLILLLRGATVGTAAAAAHPRMATHSFVSTESRMDIRCHLTKIQRPLSLSWQHGCCGSFMTSLMT